MAARLPQLKDWFSRQGMLAPGGGLSLGHGGYLKNGDTLHLEGNLEVKDAVVDGNLSIKNPVTTGSGTATFNTSNKPAGASSNSWVTLVINGTTYYIPVWQ